MYTICQTSHPATTVEHSIECRFYNLEENNLVVAGANQLTIYKINAKLLEYVQSFELYGTVASLQKVTLGNKQTCKRDSLALSFHDAKLSIVEYNPETHDLKTISMHYFEDDTLRDGCVTNHLNAPIVRVDPENRCIAMLIYGKHIVVIPLYKDEEDDLDVDIYDASSSEDDDHERPASPFKSETDIRRPIAGQVAALKPAVTPSFKSPVLPNYKIDLSEEACGEKIDNIVDIQFLYNYNDPTLVILHEPTRTWSGRVAMRQDTFSMVALSMNVHQQLQPIIWTVNNLPYDSLRILPVPKPIGGLLIVACNELIYLNQSVPAFGMSFNSFTKDSSSFPLNNIHEDRNTNHNGNDDKDDLMDYDEEEEHNGREPVKETETEEKKHDDYINISLDLSQSVFLTQNKILFILKDGDVYLVTLFNDDMRSIKNFHFERIVSTVQPNCLTLCENNLVFIGSHVGDSVLAEIVIDLKTDNLDAYYADDTIHSLISNGEKEPVNFYEHDHIFSSSASGRICYGADSNVSEVLKYNPDDPTGDADRFVELLTTAGHHHNGSVCVFQRTIKPQIEQTYDLEGHCGELWTVKPSKQSKPENSRLIINRDRRTRIFSTKENLPELGGEKFAFETSRPTVFAANIGSDNLTIQVMPMRAKLISDDTTIDSIQFDGEICDACLADPHIIVLDTNGAIHHIELRCSSQQVDGNVKDEVSGERQYGLSYHKIGSITGGQVISMSLYKDLSGLFTCSQKSPDDDTDIKPTYWLFTTDNLGLMEIFSVPNFSRVYSVDNFPSMPNVLADNVKLFVVDLDLNLSKTKEILMCGLGKNSKRPLLFVRSEMELVVYETFRYNETYKSDHLRVRFKKIHSLLLLTLIPDCMPLEMQPDQPRISDGRSTARSTNHKGSEPLSLRQKWLRKTHWLREFKNISGYNGVFLAGFKPHWFIMTDKCRLRVHPMIVEGSIYAFSTHDNDNFIYYNERRELRIARLPKHMDYDHVWPVRKKKMKDTVHFVNYHVESKIYCVVTSKPKECTNIMKVGSEPDTMKVEDLPRENGYIPPTTERFKLRLFDPENWERIPDCKIEFEEWEQVTNVKNVLLASEGTQSGLKGYIAISTNYCYGEDVPNRGKIWILDFIEVVPEPDKPLTKHKIKKVYCQEQRGPVTTLSHACGLLMSAVGQKIYLWQLKEGRLDGVAFIDTQVYIHCAASVKSLILVSDVCKSVSLLRYQEETRTLSMVCRDSKPLEVFACDFAVDNEQLNFVIADSEKNIIIYAYDPEHEDSHGGTRLLRRADFHLGAFLTSFCRISGKVPSLLARDPMQARFYHRRHITSFCTVDGSIGSLYPIDESTYRQFQMLQNEMTMALPHAAGLNPKAWRSVKQARPTIANPCKGVVDGDIITRFMMLSSRERNELSRKIGTTTDRILADIQMIHEATLYFDVRDPPDARKSRA